MEVVPYSRYWKDGGLANGKDHMAAYNLQHNIMDRSENLIEPGLGSS